MNVAANQYAESVLRVPMPNRIMALSVSEKGFPVPWFVAWIGGKPDLRVVAEGKIEAAHRKKLCWVCGQPMGRFKAMTLGPMCIINRTISEPPSHRDCAVLKYLSVARAGTPAIEPAALRPTFPSRAGGWR